VIDNARKLRAVRIEYFIEQTLSADTGELIEAQVQSAAEAIASMRTCERFMGASS
jgi:hypothetical protein